MAISKGQTELASCITGEDLLITEADGRELLARIDESADRSALVEYRPWPRTEVQFLRRAHLTKDAKRRVIAAVRQQNQQDFGPKAKQAVQRLLSAGLSHPWTYVYELTQNASDAGARRVAWQTVGDTVLFQHDGNDALDERHVRGISSLGASTKGLDSVGFMGVGFKSVFARFRTARVSGFGWQFKFDVGTQRGALGSTVTKWFDTLLPLWDEDPISLERGYTTAILLERPIERGRPASEDLERFAPLDDPTPLAVLALRGLEQVCVGDAIWNLEVDDGVIAVRCSKRESAWRWKSFVDRYRPDDDAMRRLLEVRQETEDHVDDRGKRIEREVVGLLPLDDVGVPKPPDHGRVYATLPTQVQVPFGFHLQADWFVDVDRQNLRDVDGDPWQEAILQSVPEIVRQLLVWLTQEPEAARNQGYRALRDPGTDEGILGKPFRRLRDAFVEILVDQNVVPIHGSEARRFRAPKTVSRLPGRFLVDFGGHPQWRPDLLFGRDLMDAQLLANSVTGFASWLGWGTTIEMDNVPWKNTLPEWWVALQEEEKTDALFALWHGVSDRKWDNAPVVPTEAGEWVPVSRTRWLNKEPPTANNPSGKVIATMLEEYIPRADERLPPRIRVQVNRVDNDATEWLKSRHQDVKLTSLIRQACRAAKEQDDLPLVELVEWALSRGDRRQDLVPLVMTEAGARAPAGAVIADPLVEGGMSRRELFSDKPALIEDYAIIDDRQAVVLFLTRLGVRGGGELAVPTIAVRRHERERVAALIDIDERKVEKANNDGYKVLDYGFPFEVKLEQAAALQDWLSREHSALRDKGRLTANSFYVYQRLTPGEKRASWVRMLQELPWLRCTDGRRLKPGDVLPEPDLDFEDAPVAEIDEGLRLRLKEEGVLFGSSISKSPVLRRLVLRGGADTPDGDLAELLREAHEHVEAGSATREELLRALDAVRIRGRALRRTVQRSGAGRGLRSDLNGYVLALADVDLGLTEAVNGLGLEIPATTTGQHALDFLQDVWTRSPQHVDSIRGHIASAYRYVLDDAVQDDALARAWHQARIGARLYADGNWHQVNSNLAVDDVQSPLIRQFLPEGRVVVASAHLGDTNDQVGRVASALGISLLSKEVDVHRGARVGDPPWIERLRKLGRLLASLDDRNDLRELVFHDKLSIRMDGVDHSISAYVDDRTLMLVGEPRSFAVEAAGQLVEFFQLGQRGTEVAWLTGALFYLDDKDGFFRNLQVLAHGLRVGLPEGTLEQNDPGQAEPGEQHTNENGSSDNQDHRAQNDASPDSVADHERRRNGENGEAVPGGMASGQEGEPHARSDRSDFAEERKSASGGDTNPASETRTPSPNRRAADHFGLLVMRNGREQRVSGDTYAGSGNRRDDHKARQAVIQYESRHDRRAEAMDEYQPGYDVISVDESTSSKRRIEVKGVQGIFEEDASVVLTARQVHDALENAEAGVEYWLYVVDSTETARPRVCPIPWTRERTRLRYGFPARVWTGAAEEPLD